MLNFTPYILWAAWAKIGLHWKLLVRRSIQQIVFIFMNRKETLLLSSSLHLKYPGDTYLLSLALVSGKAFLPHHHMLHSTLLLFTKVSIKSVLIFACRAMNRTTSVNFDVLKLKTNLSDASFAHLS